MGLNSDLSFDEVKQREWLRLCGYVERWEEGSVVKKYTSMNVEGMTVEVRPK